MVTATRLRSVRTHISQPTRLVWPRERKRGIGEVIGKVSPIATSWANQHAEQRHLKKLPAIVRADSGVCRARIADPPPTVTKYNVHAAGRPEKPQSESSRQH